MGRCHKICITLVLFTILSHPGRVFFSLFVNGFRLCGDMYLHVKKLHSTELLTPLSHSAVSFILWTVE